MKEKIFSIKAWFAAFCTALGTLLGWRGITAAVWIAAMILDYISGTAAACKSGAWSSTAARQGLFHKGGMILVVAVAAIADCAIVMIGAHLPTGFRFAWPGAVFPLVLAWYILTELGSVLENAITLGADVPEWLSKMLKIGLSAVDRAGSTAADQAKKEDGTKHGNENFQQRL